MIFGRKLTLLFFTGSSCLALQDMDQEKTADKIAFVKQELAFCNKLQLILANQKSTGERLKEFYEELKKADNKEHDYEFLTALAEILSQDSYWFSKPVYMDKETYKIQLLMDIIKNRLYQLTHHGEVLNNFIFTLVNSYWVRGAFLILLYYAYVFRNNQEFFNLGVRRLT